MKNTLNEVMNNLLTEEEIQEVNAEAKEEITRIRRGKRAGIDRALLYDVFKGERIPKSIHWQKF